MYQYQERQANQLTLALAHYLQGFGIRTTYWPVEHRGREAGCAHLVIATTQINRGEDSDISADEVLAVQVDADDLTMRLVRWRAPDRSKGEEGRINLESVSDWTTPFHELQSDLETYLTEQTLAEFSGLRTKAAR